MKIIRILILLCLFVIPSFAQMQERVELQNLLAERAKKFGAYTSTIQKRSGIFGNKTKNDIQKSNEVLISIVTLDNDIMDVLNRSLNYKVFEKTAGDYSSRDCELKLKQSMEVTDTLLKQLAVAEEKLQKPGPTTSFYKPLFFLLLIICVVLVWQMRRLSKA